MNTKIKLKGVNKMQMPGFTAESSLYKSEGHYYMHGASNQGRAAILPAGGGGDCFNNCLANNCSDLTGQEALDCRKACARTCSPATGGNMPSFGPCAKPFLSCLGVCALTLNPGCIDGCLAAADLCILTQ